MTSHNGYDLAFIVLKEKAIPSSSIQIANLPERDAPCPLGKSLVLSGWGHDRTRPYRSQRYLWAVKQQCLNNAKCPFHARFEGAMICVGDEDDSRNSACNGDSGGIIEPLKSQSM